MNGDMTAHLQWPTRHETDADIPSVRRINLAAFGTAEESDLVDALRIDPGWINGLSIGVGSAADLNPGPGPQPSVLFSPRPGGRRNAS